MAATTRQTVNVPGRGKFGKTSADLPPPSQRNGSSFCQELFDDNTSVEIRNAVLGTKFFQDMVKGTLDPTSYGGYMVQDAAYCFNAVEAYDFAAQQMQGTEPRFSLLYRVHSESYKRYNQDFVKQWRLKNSESVEMGPAAGMYVGFESNVSRKDPKFLSIAMLPCSMLWPWVADQLIEQVQPDNPYYFWFEENKPEPGHKSTLEQFVDSFFKEEDKAQSLPIFHEGLANELNFFRDACGEPLYYSKTVCI